MQELLVILVDDPGLLEMFRHSYFQRAKVQLEVVHSEREFWLQLQAGVPDLVVLSLGFAGCDGAMLCHALCADRQFRKIPVILLAREGVAEDLRHCHEAEFDVVISRPIKREELLTAAYRLLQITDRAEPRFEVALNALCGIELTAIKPAKVLNISSDGAFLDTAHLKPVDTKIELAIRMPGSGTTFRCQARVAWLNSLEHPLAPHLPPGMGLEYMNLTPEQRVLLKQVVARLSVD